MRMTVTAEIKEKSHWMNADQVAEYLALPSRKAVYEAARRGEIPCYRLGRRLRFRREELDAVLLRQRQCASALDDISSRGDDARVAGTGKGGE
jgi:excisionase family DNA binding protein